METKTALDVSRFSWTQMFNNSKGKTSLSFVCAFMMISTGCLVVGLGASKKFPDALLHGVALCGLGSGLLGIRRFTKDKDVTIHSDDEIKA